MCPVQCGRVMEKNISLVDSTGKITKGLLSAQNKNNLDTLCSEINFPDNKIQRIKPWTLKTLVALKIFVHKKQEKKYSSCVCPAVNVRHQNTCRLSESVPDYFCFISCRSW